jgi:hypothetical protein
MFNQALFERLLILDDEIIDATPAAWVRALEDVAREVPAQRRGSEDPKWALGQGPRGAVRERRGVRTTMAPVFGAMV